MKMKRVIETIVIPKEPCNAVLVVASQKETCNAVPVSTSQEEPAFIPSMPASVSQGEPALIPPVPTVTIEREPAFIHLVPQVASETESTLVQTHDVMLAMASQKRPALFRPNSGVPAAAGHEEPAVGDVDLHSQSSGVSYSTVAGRKRHLSESENLQLLK